MKKAGVALLGLGTVGSGTYKILTENKEHIKDVHGVEVEVLHILERDTTKARALGIDTSIVSTDINNIVSNPDISIVAEFFGGIEPARSFLIAALKAGKSIVTANKELFSKHWEELQAAAEEGGAKLFFEASCLGGVPVIRTLSTGLQGDNILSVMGIFNGTTNYILTKMADEGLEYEDVLKEAQRLGYAEANPSADVDGFDSMYKLSILSTLAFSKKVPLDKIYREGISKVSKTDIEIGKSFGYALKLLAIAKNENGKIEARVHPTFVPETHPLASVKGSFNALLIKGDNVGDIMLYGRGAGDRPTGSAIVSDIVFAAKGGQASPLPSVEKMKNQVVEFNENFNCPYYIRLSAEDKSGVLAKIASALGKYSVNINSMQQITDGDKASIVFMLHATGEVCLNKAIQEIKSLEVVKSVDAVIRVI